MRGTFANIRIKNQMLDGVEGGYTLYDGKQTDIYDAAMAHVNNGTPLVVIAGKEYGTGSSRDWAAKGTRLLGVKAVVAESFERIHRSNLIGMGILPLQFNEGDSADSLNISGNESFSIAPVSAGQKTTTLTITDDNGNHRDVELQVRIDTGNEFTYYQHGGILHYVIRRFLTQ